MCTLLKHVGFSWISGISLVKCKLKCHCTPHFAHFHKQATCKAPCSQLAFRLYTRRELNLPHTLCPSSHPSRRSNITHQPPRSVNSPKWPFFLEMLYMYMHHLLHIHQELDLYISTKRETQGTSSWITLSKGASRATIIDKAWDQNDKNAMQPVENATVYTRGDWVTPATRECSVGVFN